MAEWIVRLVGDDIDLGTLAGEFTGPDMRIFREGGEFYLAGATLETFTEAGHVRAYVDNLLPLLSAALQIADSNATSVRADSVYRLHEGGRRDAFVYVTATAALRARVGKVVVRIDGEIVEPADSVTIAQRLAAAHRDSNVELAFRFFAAEDNWFNLYKVWETIRRDVRGESAMIAYGWGSKVDHDRFTFSANEYRASGTAARHAPRTAKGKDPLPMSQRDAREFIRALLDSWVGSK